MARAPFLCDSYVCLVTKDNKGNYVSETTNNKTPMKECCPTTDEHLCRRLDAQTAHLISLDAIQPRHCSDILHAGQRTSGVYTIFHKAAGPSGQSVYCDMDVDGGGWTVIQQRGQFGNNVYYFYRNWTEYAEGFGKPAKEYWIGETVELIQKATAYALCE